MKPFLELFLWSSHMQMGFLRKKRLKAVVSVNLLHIFQPEMFVSNIWVIYATSCVFFDLFRSRITFSGLFFFNRFVFITRKNVVVTKCLSNLVLPPLIWTVFTCFSGRACQDAFVRFWHWWDRGTVWGRLVSTTVRIS